MSNAAYVSRNVLPQQPPPPGAAGPLKWVRENLFSSPMNIALTLLGLYLVATSVPSLVNFYILDAVWSGGDRDACLRDKVGREIGACWAFIGDRYPYFIYGSYPLGERWRVNLVFLMFALGVVWLLWERIPYKAVAALFFFVIFPALAWMLLSGGPRPQFVVVSLGVAMMAWFIFSDVKAVKAGDPTVFSQGGTILRYALILLMTLAGLAVGGEGLPSVDTGLWGGILVTLLIASVGIVFSLPFGIALALGRRSKLPIIKMFSVIFIEFVRGVPLITVLFMANTMLPLFVPQEYSPDRLLRPLIGVALFAAAYMAEVVRGGLQAIPKGQYEGAMSLGLGYGSMMRLIVLPQALRIVIPGIVNTFIGLFKDTTLVTVVGIFDFMRTVEASMVDPTWATPTTRATGYAFAAVFYFICCWGMSRYSISVESKLAAGQKR
jgi:general L-amino acid transport system permease protein